MRQPSKGAFDLTPDRRARLEQRLRETGVTPSDVERIVPRSNGARCLPLSFAQERLWFLDQLEPDNPFYNAPTFMPLPFAVDVEALHRSLKEIVRRHEVLRTTFATIDGKPTQVVHEAHPLPLPSVDLAALPAADREAEVWRLANEEARRPFDLTRDIPLRASLVRLGPGSYHLFLTVHHIAWDGWSASVLAAELTTLYRAFTEGRASPLAELDIQYADFAAWQRQSLGGERLQTLLAYWRRQLAGLPQLDLPTDHPRPGQATHRGAFQAFAIPPTVSAAVQQLARSNGLTQFMLLVAVFSVLLHRYTRQDDIVIGAPIANRTSSQTEALIGFFVNTLVLRNELSGDPTFTELMVRVKAVALEAYAHQDLPFELLVEDLEPERSLGSNPLFQVGFVLQTAWNLFAARGGLAEHERESSASRPIDVERGTAIFDLAMHLWETPAGLTGGLEYTTDLFQAATVARMARHYVNLLESAVRNPDVRVSRLAMLSGEERSQLLLDFSGVLSGPGEARCIHQLLDEQADRLPDAVALRFGDQTMTWRELNESANQLAHYLTSRGVRAETRVAICMDRGLRMIVGVLAILKAGAAYVPIDAAIPQQRREFILRHANVMLVLTQHPHAPEAFAPGIPALACVDLDEEWRVVSHHSRLGPVRNPVPDGLAYIIYTSGSTGTPKGVLVTHRGLLNMAEAQRSLFRLGEADRILQFASPAFDASIFEIVLALGSGAALHLAPSADLMPGASLAAMLRTEAISVVTLPPSALEALGRDEYPALRTICVAGEACPGKLAAYWRRGRRLFNLYGPTEATVWATAGECGDDPGDPPIGKPIPHVSTYVLDRHLEPVPIGVTGELCIGGMGLARGYAELPEQTAERFLANPFAANAGERLYRTGDLVRFLADGRLEYRGRLDRQIKLWGNRIELGEIESVLNSHPQVREAVVIARRDPPEDQRLVAYLTRGEQPDVAAVGPGGGQGALQVAYWRTRYDQTYGQVADALDPALDFYGWNSSYTGKPIPAAQMGAWLDHTVERILRRHPARVLEIGCGNGLVLSRLLPACEVLWGTDFSAAVLQTAGARLRAQAGNPARFTLQQRDANDFSGLPRGYFDAVVLNSVAQYFPGVHYLLEVIRGAADLLAPGGFLYLGDVRSLPLLEAFHVSVELGAAAPDLPVSRLRERVNNRVRQEQELLVDPRLFDDLPELVPHFGRSLVELKRGGDDNELTRFRYDVTLLPGNERTPGPDVEPVAWRPGEWGATQLEATLRRHRPAVLSLRGLPNARVRYEAAAAALLAEARETSPRTTEEVRVAARAAAATNGMDPESFYRCGSELGYEVEVRWSETSAECFDVRLWRAGSSELHGADPALTASARRGVRPADALEKYGNDPPRGRLERNWLPDVRRHLEQRLPHYMVPAKFVPLHDLPRNASGKVDRAALPAPDDVRPDLQAGYCAPRTPVERALADVWAAVLGVERVGINDNFFELGGDSILSIQIIARANRIGLIFTARDLFQRQTIAEICEVVESTLRVEDEPATIAGRTLLSPMQHWFFEQDIPEPAHFNQSVEMDATGLEEASLRRAFQYLLTHHDVLRTRFRCCEDGWIQTVEAPGTEVPFHCDDLEGTHGAGRAAALQAACLRWQQSLSLEDGPLVRVVLFREAGVAQRLLWIIHHLVVDGVSWRILLEDLQTVYQQIRQGQEPWLPRKTTSFQAWAARLQEFAQSQQLLGELSWWLGQAGAPCLPLPRDAPHGPNDVASTFGIATTFGAEDTHALLSVLPQTQRVRIHEVLIAALAQSLARWTGSRNVRLDLESHGRDELFDGIDVSRTVGWFTALYPVVLEVDQDQQAGELLASVKERLRRVANGGLGYGMLRYMCRDARSVERIAQLPQAEVAFNYLGQFQGAGTPMAAEPVRDQTRGDSVLRCHAIEINASVAGGRLHMRWMFSANIHTRASAQRLVGEYDSALARLLAHGASNAPARYTPADFQHARVSQSDLDRLLAKFHAAPPS